MCASVVVGLAGVATASASTTIGQLAPGSSPPASCSADSYDELSPTVSSGSGYVVPPGDGLITSWSTNAAAGSGQMLELKVFRQVSGLTYMVVGHDGPHALAPSTINTFSANVPVQAGDIVGLQDLASSSSPTACVFKGSSDTDVERKGDLQDGASGDFAPFPGNRVNVTAVVEPAPGGQPRPTAGTIICNYTVLTSADTCTATIADAGTGQPVTPTGMVSFGSPTGGTFLATSCLLAPVSEPAGGAGCSVQFIPRDFPRVFPNVVASYGGDQAHSSTSAHTSLGGLGGSDPQAEPSDTTIQPGAAPAGQLPGQIAVETDAQASGATVGASVSDGPLFGAVAGRLPAPPPGGGGLGPAVDRSVAEMIASIAALNATGEQSASAQQAAEDHLAAMLANLVSAINQGSFGTLTGGRGGLIPRTAVWVIGHLTFPPPPPPPPNTEGLLAYVVGGQGIDSERVTVQPGGDVTITLPSADLLGGGGGSVITGLARAEQDALNAPKNVLDPEQQQQIRRQLEELGLISAMAKKLHDLTQEIITKVVGHAGDVPIARSSRVKRHRSSAPLLAVTVKRNVHAGRITLVLRLSHKGLRRLLGRRRSLTVYVRVVTFLPSEFLPGGYPIATVRRVTLHLGARHHRR